MKFDMVEKTKKLPLTEERVTFTAWWPISAGFATVYDNYADYPNMIEMENRTNIHIEYVHPSSSEVTVLFPLMLASEDYCDMIYYAGLYPGGGDKAIEDGVYIRLNELIEKYAPNYNTIRNYTEEARKMTITNSGNIWGFYNICKENMPGYMGLNIRKDYLDRIGYEGRPRTIDDWDHVLGRMLEEIDTLQYALAIPPTGKTQHSAFSSAWDVGSEWYQVNGKVKYGPAEPEYRNYVELMKRWYDKGYLRKDFYSVNPANYNNEVCWQDYGSGACGATDGANSFGTMLYQFGMSTDPNIFVVAVRQPVLKEGDETHLRFDQGVVNPGAFNSEQLAITTACKDPALLTSWVDYRYTFDGYMLIYYGIEGLSYKFTDDYYINITENVIMNVLAGIGESAGPTGESLLYNEDGTVKNRGGALAVFQTRPEFNAWPNDCSPEDVKRNMINRDYWLTVNGCSSIPQIAIKGEHNFAFYSGGKADLVFLDIKNRDHGQALDEAELMWDYLFSGTRRDAEGKIVQTDPKIPRKGDEFAIAIAEGCSNAWFRNSVVPMGGKAIKWQKLKYHGLNGGQKVRGEYLCVPVRFLAEVFGAEYTPSGDTLSASLRLDDGRELQFARGVIGCLIDGHIESMLCEALHRNGELYISFEWFCKRLYDLHVSEMAGTIYATDHYSVLSNNMAHIIRDLIR